jgi:hypothetical protein
MQPRASAHYHVPLIHRARGLDRPQQKGFSLSDSLGALIAICKAHQHWWPAADESKCMTLSLKILMLATGLGISVSALALDYPPILRGSYVYQGAECQNPALVIEQSRRFNDTDAECRLKTLTTVGAARFAAVEQCSREGRNWSQSSVFALEQSTLRLKEGDDQMQFMQCGASAAAPAPVAATPAATGGVMSCKVVPGQAGVTTYLDAALTRPGNSIRDFDDYTFRAAGKILVNKTEILVGQLLRSDGSVSEPKSWAMAEEWECQ